MYLLKDYEEIITIVIHNQISIPYKPGWNGPFALLKIQKNQLNVIKSLSMSMLIIQHGCNLPIQFILFCLHGYHLSWHFPNTSYFK